MSYPVWLLDLLKSSPWVAIPAGLALLGYKMFHKLMDSPLSIATFFSVAGTKAVRDDARKTVEILCDRDGDPPAIEAPPSRPPRTGRRRRRKRRR